MTEQINTVELTRPAEVDLKMERVRALVDQIKSVVGPLEELASATDEIRQDVQQQLAGYALSLKTTKLKPEELEAFFKKPYLTLPVPGKRDNWYLIIPRFVDIQVGWLERQTEAYNVFLVNRYVEWLGDLPEEIKRQLGFKPGLHLELQGDQLIGPREDLKKAWEKYRPLLKDIDEKRIVINQHRAFDLIASLVKDGILPFTPKPVQQSDLLDRPVDFELRDYQKDAYNKFLRYSNIGVFFPASVGKTFLGLYAMSKIKGPHLVVVPTRLLVEQWVDRIEAHTQLKPEDYVVTTYQSAIKKHAGKEWGLKIIDEVHHMPANQFSKIALIKSKYIIGLTASPTREDGREEYIFALTGYPVGLGWQHFKEIGIIKSPICYVWLLKNFEAKVARIRALLQEEKKTLIFSDSIETGKIIASRFNLPHIFGETKDRLSTIQSSPVAVISRVGDEGVSLPDIERVIEVNWLFGSRRQELQRFTRLLHGQTSDPGEHYILMTVDEYLHDRKRLFSIMDKGFKLEIHREGVSEESINKRLEAPQMSRPRRASQVREEQPPAPQTPEAINGVLSLPGVKKIMAGLTGPQKRVYELLIRNDGQWFKKSSLPLLLGYVSENSLRVTVNFPEMVQRGLIEQRRTKEGTEYRTNIRSRASGGVS
jgi:DNA excision repair protein ERCC-3